MTTPLDREDLRNALIDTILAHQPVPGAVERALRTVRRDLHLPGLDPTDAYSDRAVSIKDNPAGPLALSCASQPSVVAMMLAQLDPRPGERILEIGAGTGYNAALLQESVGPTGTVVTVDVDPEVTLYARNALNRSGHPDVVVMNRDGLLGAPEHGPFDAIIATVGMWDLPTPWWSQLRDGGRLVLPLRWRGQTRSVTLIRDGDILRSTDMALCGFVPVIGQDGEHTTSLRAGTVRLHHDIDQAVHPEALAGVFTTTATDMWSSTTVGGEESFDGIWLRATARTDTVCRIEVTGAALDAGIRRPAIPIRTPALVDDQSIAYMTIRRDEHGHRLGATSYGPAGANLARQLTDIINTWGAERLATPTVSIHKRHGTPTPPTAHPIAKRDSTLTLQLPTRSE